MTHGDPHIPDSPGDRAALRDHLLAQTPEPFPKGESRSAHGTPGPAMSLIAGALENARRTAELNQLERDLLLRERDFRQEVAVFAGIQASDWTTLRRFRQRFLIGAGLSWGLWLLAAGWLAWTARHVALLGLGRHG